MNIKPLAIYGGANCSKKDKIILYSIAKAKGLKIYKMSVTNTIEEYLLRCELVTVKERDNIIEKLEFDILDIIRNVGKAANESGKDVFANWNIKGN